MQPLPIDPLLPDVAARLAEGNTLVLEAPPGAGKTTRIPHVLLAWGRLARDEAVVLEPRRLAARLAARRVAEELGERPGERVGWQVRFEDVSSPRTRVRFVTEGVLTRRLLGNPTLKGVAAVVFDEFHERHLQGDVGLALARRLQLGPRPDLRIVVMSATLDAAPVRTFLDAPLLRAEGRRFEIDFQHAEKDDDRPLAQQVASAVRRLVQQGLDGDVLVFLPGAGEIRRATETVAPIAEQAGLEVLPLHGELSPEQQDRAVRKGAKRKVILSTNVAESSVTIDGVVAVIDSGLARVAGYSPWSGLPTLRLAKVSRASATQRAGRAGRTGPGRAIRLYTRHDFESRPAHDEPEIRRSELSQTVLEVAATGARMEDLPWFEPPPKPSLEAAESLLVRLGAIERDGAITPLGRRMADMPVHPRLARLVLEGERRDVGREAAALAALLGERDVRESNLFGRERGQARATSDSDPLDLLDLFLSARSQGLSADAMRRHGLDPGATKAADRSRQVLERGVKAGPTRLARDKADEALKAALLAAFPDRVAKRRSAGGRDVVFAFGGSAAIGEQSAVRNAEWLVAVDAEERRPDGRGLGGGAQVRSASAIEPEWLLDLPDVEERTATEWNERLQRVDASTRIQYGALVIDESPGAADPKAVARMLFEQAKAAGPRVWDPDERLERLLRRIAFVARTFPESGVVAISPERLDALLLDACEGRRSIAELREASVPDLILAELPNVTVLDRLAPETVTLPGGRRTRVEYEPDQPPAISSRLQDFFGMAQGPSLGGRVPLVLHLLAPNGRDVQVTTDLAGFWERHYPALRKELMRRYPRHAWPEDPRTATPPTGGRGR